MKIILLKDVAKLGKKYDVKNVSDGYATNLLIPQKSAIAATRDALKRLQTEIARSEGERKVREDLLVKNIEGLQSATITIKGKANDKGHLFAGIHKEEIVRVIESQTRLQIDPTFIELEHPIKEVGEHMLNVKGAGKSVKVKIVVDKA